MDNIMRAYMAFMNSCPDDALEHWQPASVTPYTSIDVSSRYFTERNRAPNELDMPFERLVDPEGVLQGLKSLGFLHGPDNYVEYMERTVQDGKVKLVLRSSLLVVD